MTTGLAPLAEVPLYSIVEAFQRVLARSKVKLSHDVVADRISISDRIVELTDFITARKRALFEDLFDGQTSRFDLVITFLAILEMTRLRITRLVQVEPLSPLYVEAAGVEAAGVEAAGVEAAGVESGDGGARGDEASSSGRSLGVDHASDAGEGGDG